MSSEYSILDNKPLDHWKVTELKEELRRRKLTTKGLKEDLIKRLDEALRSEKENLSGQYHSKIQEILVTNQSQEIETGKNSDQANDRIESESDSITPAKVVVMEENAIPIVNETERKKKLIEDIDINAPIDDPYQEHGIKIEKSAITIDLEQTSEVTPEVSEVSPDLGTEVKSDPIYNDSVPLGEQNEPKTDLNVKTFDLQEPVKPESDVNESFVEDEDSKKIDGSIVGSPEKLNLDRSSGDESMEDDVLETKHVESNDISVESGDKETRDLHVIREEALASMEKRKAEVEDVNGGVETTKRQRRWAAEPIRIPEKLAQQSLNQSDASATPAVPPLTPVQAATAASIDSNSPKERVVPPSQKAPTTSLRIDRFVRPFTLKAVQELLSQTGTVSSFWMDHIKTHCYVTYSSVEEAVATRNGVYNLQWPPNGGRLLVAEFVDPEEVKSRAEAPPESPVPTTPAPVVPVRQVAAPTRQLPVPARQLPPPPPPLPVAPPKAVEPPILTLDDLFKKTKATPRIYYLPLTEEQVAAKGKSSEG